MSCEKLPRPSSPMARSICRSGRLRRNANSSTAISTSGSNREDSRNSSRLALSVWLCSAATSLSICWAALFGTPVDQGDDDGAEPLVVLAKRRQDGGVAEDFVQPCRALEQRYLGVQVLRQARSLHAVDHQSLAVVSQAPHLYGGIENGKQQRPGQHAQTEQ